MRVFSGKNLKRFIDSRNIYDLQYRDAMPDLSDYLSSDKAGKVCCLYGLRRTGKTVMMLQSIVAINDYNNCLYIYCENGDSLGNVTKTLDKYQSKYIFIDEVTKSYDFIKTCSVLSDIYASSERRIVLAGTDSLGFMISKSDELFDRVNMIHTTYIPFSEFNRLLGKNLDYYIQYGGLLVSEDGKAYNDDVLKEYTDGSIVHNITHSLNNWNYGRNHVVDKLKAVNDYGDLPSIIHKVIDRENRDFLAATVNNSFASEELGSLLDLLVQHHVVDTESLNREQLNELFRSMLAIREPLSDIYSQYTVDLIKDYLVDLEVLYRDKGNNEYIFIQPGVRYYHTKVLADAFINEMDNGTFTLKEKTDVLSKLDSAIKGHILEDTVYVELAKLSHEKNIEVFKYRERKYSGEFDVVLIDQDKNEAAVFEVKNSSIMVQNQLRHLLNKELCDGLEAGKGARITSKAVIYNGSNQYDSENNIDYINAEDFLKNVGRSIEIIFENDNSIHVGVER